mmetsp:Transcript_12290/g.31038  ORF Transcript_12290/g.31038 Transcript_12290/m.31038 type:complete len:243 (-) Transcript_12290:1193-1921(-)
MHYTVAGHHVGYHKGGWILPGVVFALLKSRDWDTGSNVFTECPRILAVGHFYQVFSGFAWKIILVKDLVFDSVKQQQLGHVIDALVGGNRLNIGWRKLQKGHIGWSKERPRAVGQSVRNAANFEIVAQNGELWIVTHNLVNSLAGRGWFRCRRNIVRRGCWFVLFGRGRRSIHRWDTEILLIVVKHHLIDHVQNSVAGFDIGLDDFGAFLRAVSFSLLVNTATTANGTAVFSVRHFQEVLAT